MLAEVTTVKSSGLGDGVGVGDLALGEDVVSDETPPVGELRRKGKDKYTQLEWWVVTICQKILRILLAHINLKD